MKVELCLCISLLGLIGAVNASQDEEFDPADDPKFTASPCPDLDLECIREYFSKNSVCEIAQGPTPDPLLIEKYRAEIPHCNLTVDVRDAKFLGLSQLKVVEFYLNSATNKLVLAAESSSMRLDSSTVYFKYNRRCREPIERTDSVACTYGTLTFTVVFPSFTNLSLRNAEVFTYIHNPNPEYSIGRKSAARLDPKFISRPCPGFDIDCIREYFAKNSHCDKSDGLIPVPLFAKQISVEIPNSNVTIDIKEVNLRGLEHIDIIEFYINNATNKLVMAADIPFLQLETQKAHFKLNRNCKEPIEKIDSATCQFGGLTFTMVYPSFTNLRLRDAEVFTYVEDTAPQYVLGSGASANLGPEEIRQFQTMLSNVSVGLRELFVYLGRFLMANFIQIYVCDFGLDLDG